MNQWSIRRKRIVLSIVISTLIIFIGVPSFFAFYRAPTCFDNKQNADETGVDCGGSCQLLCRAESLPLITKSDPRVIKITDNSFEVVALIENPNIVGEIYRAGYTFKLYDASSIIPIKIIEGETFVPKNTTFAVFEGPFFVEQTVVPTRVTFEWKARSLVWKKNTVAKPELDIKNIVLSREDTKPRINANLTNLSLGGVSNIELISTVSDERNNILAASKTYVERIKKGESLPVVFTWPDQFKIKSEICESPVDVSIVLDRSGSMQFLSQNPDQPMTDVKTAARFFASELSELDQVSVVSYASEASNPVDSTLTSNFTLIDNVIKNISITPPWQNQHTNVADGILKGSAELFSSRAKSSSGKALVVLTDGVSTRPIKPGGSKNSEDTKYPEATALTIGGNIKSRGIQIFTIGLGKDIHKEFLASLASSADDFYLAPTAKDLKKIYSQIATKICKKKPAVITIFPRIFPDSSFIR